MLCRRKLVNIGREIISILYQAFLALIAPKFCFLCLQEGDYLCSICLTKLKFQKNYFCFHCRKRLKEGTLCQKAHQHLIKYYISFAEYQEPLRKLVILGKYGRYFEIFQFFGQLIKPMLKSIEDFYLVPVPMTKQKLLLRGFNQAEVLAKSLNQQKVLPILVKIRETKEQANLNFAERKTNLQNAFALKEKPPAKVILIDDVITSGATLQECAQVLKKQGAKEIIALTILH